VLRVECPTCQTVLDIDTDQRREVVECSECLQDFIALADEVIKEPDQIRRKPTHSQDQCCIVGLVATLFGLFFFWCPPIGLILNGVGRHRRVAISGIVLSVVGCIYGLGLTVLFIAVSIIKQEEFGKQNTPVNRQQPVVQFP
jgi:hypothetical protein